MEKSETVNNIQRMSDMFDLAIGQRDKAESERDALAAQVRELEYALECSKNFGATVNARVTELEQSLAAARTEIRNEFREALTAASRILAAFSRDKWKDGQGVKVSDMDHARQLLHKALYAEAGGGEHGR